MNIIKSFNDSWSIYTKNFITLVLAFILVILISVFTFGILAIPLMVGYQMMFLKAKRGESFSTNIIFSQFKKYFRLIFASLLIGIIEVAAFIPALLLLNMDMSTLGNIFFVLGLLFDIFIGVSFIFALLLIADKDLKVRNSLKTSMDLVLKNNFWMHLVLIVLVGIVTQIGSFAWGVGVIFTAPLAIGAISCAYADEVQ